MNANPIRPFYAMEIMARAQGLEAQGRMVAHLEIGEPGGKPAQAVLDAVRGCLDRPMGYTAAKGLPALRERLSRYYAERHGVAVPAERIVVTTGSSSGFILTFLAGFAPGQRIAVTRPGYPAYLNILASLNLASVEIPVSPANGWRLTAADIEAAIIACCDRLGVRFISDEIYHGLNYVGGDASALEFSHDHVIVNSFSKYYCMTGWRVGWLVLPEDLIRRAEMMAQSLFISASSPSQWAALAALDAREEYDLRRDQYAENRTVLSQGLSALGFKLAEPSDGAFYAYVDASAFTNDTMDFCIRMLDQAGVAATPGQDFDRTDGHKYVRFSYAGTREAIEAALTRMQPFLHP